MVNSTQISDLEESTRHTVAFLGPLGTYTHEAAHRKFGNSVDYHAEATITDVFRGITSRNHLGVVPQENSIFGSVVETYDALRRNDFGFVCGEITLGVQHCLLVRKGVSLSDIKTVMSHEQALGQCTKFLVSNLPSVSLVKTSSTAAAAKAVLEKPPGAAAICSKLCVTIFEGLEVLHTGIQNESNNLTRFYVIGTDQDVRIPLVTPERHAVVRFCITSLGLSPTGRDCHGTDVMKFLSPLALNITRIDRRPSLDGVPFRDLYFIELQGMDYGEQKPWTLAVDKALERLRQAGADATVIGLW